MPLPPYDSIWEYGRTRRAFDRFFSGYPFPARTDRRFYEPEVQVNETEKEVIITCEIPTFEKKQDIEVEIEGRTLYIRSISNPRNGEPFQSHFRISVTLPVAVFEEDIKVTCEKEVLKIELPKIQFKKIIEVDIH